jgi:hypothetical protein
MICGQMYTLTLTGMSQQVIEQLVVGWSGTARFGWN